MTKVLVELAIREGLYDSINVLVEARSFTHTLDYINVPFRCVRCHKVGQIMVNYTLSFVKNKWVPVSPKGPSSSYSSEKDWGKEILKGENDHMEDNTLDTVNNYLGGSI